MIKRGFTVIEMLVVIAILVVLAGVSIAFLLPQKQTATVDRDAQNALTYLQRARNQSLSSVDNSSFGVNFASTSAAFFKGTSYGAAGVQSSFTYAPSVYATVALTGGATQVYFNRLSGEPSVTGTITFRSSLNASTTKVIYIRATGLSEIQ